MKKTTLTWVLIFLNLIGFFFGIYYYSYQLSQLPFWTWILVIDCPLFVLLFALVLFFDVENNFFNFFVSVGLFKYGFWTVFVILLMWEQFLAVSPVMYPLLAIAHFFMAFEFIFILPRMKVSKWNFLVIPILFFMDYADYFWNLRPWLPNSAPINLIIQVTFASSSIVPVLLTIPIALYNWRLKVIWESESPQTRKKASATSARKKRKSGKSSKKKRKKSSASAKNARKKAN